MAYQRMPESAYVQQPVQPQQVAVVGMVTPAVPVQRYLSPLAAKSVKIISIMQIVIGVICILFQIATTSMAQVAISNRHRSPSTVDQFLATGIWCGILYVVTGVVGTLASMRNTRGLIIGMLVMNILLAAGVSVTMVAMNGVSLVLLITYYCDNNYHPDGIPIKCYWGRRSAMLGLDAVMLILSLINFGFGLGLSVVGCRNICCPTNRQPFGIQGQAVAYPPQGFAGQSGYVYNQAGGGYVSPGYQPGYQPAASANQAGTYQKSGTAFQQSGTVSQQPGSAIQQPGTAIQQSETAIQQPGTAIQQPNAPYQPPGPAYGLPTQNYHQPGDQPSAYDERRTDPAGVHSQSQ